MKKYLKKKLINSDIRDNLVKILRERLIEIDKKKELIIKKKYGLEIKNLFITNSLVENEIFCYWLNNLLVKNMIDETYLFFNYINILNPIYFEKESKEYKIKIGFEKHPVRGVNWYGAYLFAKSVGGRLLTETEWEICAQSGNPNALYPWGKEKPNHKKANYGNFIGNTTEICSYPANDWGFYDMAGNVREWINDCYYDNIKGVSEIKENKKISQYKVVKGGAWDKTKEHLKIKKHEGKWKRVGTLGIGFRVAFSNEKEREIL